MIRFPYPLNRFPFAELILSLCVLVGTLYALYALVSVIHQYIGTWYFVASGVLFLSLRGWR